MSRACCGSIERSEVSSIGSIVFLAPTVCILGDIDTLQNGFVGGIGKPFASVKHFLENIHAGHGKPVKKITAPFSRASTVFVGCDPGGIEPVSAGGLIGVALV